MKNEFIDKIDEFILSSFKEGDSSSIDAYLESNGYDLDAINSVADQGFKKISFTIKAHINQQKNEMLLDKVASLFQNALNKNIEKPISYLRNLVETNQLAFHHRNLNKLTADGIKEIIKDQNLLEILEELENDNES
jgi:hypothetical protein